MQWPVPNIPEKQPHPRPEYKKWGATIFILLAAGVMLVLFFGSVTSYRKMVLYGMLPVFFIWLCLFGAIWHRYERSVNDALLWGRESEQIKLQWQRWCMRQWVVVSNIILTPEKEGVNALLGDYADIPAYPCKSRPLHTVFSGLKDRLEYIDAQTEKQYPGYRHLLYSVKILLPDIRQRATVGQAVYQQWDLYPEYINSVDDIQTDSGQGGLVLLLCIQNWFTAHCKKHSEFISGQIITTISFASAQALPVMAGMGRVLSADSLTRALDTLSEYNKLNSTDLHHIWLTGTDNDDRVKVVQYAGERQWPLPAKLPCHLLDHTFGPSGPLSFPLSIALMIDAAVITGEAQLLISRQKENEYSLCLITRELFL
ncbi:hypothetical protein O7047_13865 [Pseudenterobacter timonensis]|uniref:Uncharacterized protein n=1 Tax=Pseudenterobacter timonensis TaxID=1755099 RepID=A0AAE4IVH5_9ENTR|nr:hypothetical protein [Pseudenterobacter timonensis]MDR9891310.1 hypothetical protein [Pseudenterobacter timonensis]